MSYRGTISTESSLASTDTISAPRGAASPKVIALFGASDSNSKLYAYNMSTTFGGFTGALIGRSNTTSISLLPIAQGTTDTGTDPFGLYNATIAGGAVATRPCFGWFNYTSLLAILTADGKLGIGYSSVADVTHMLTVTRPAATSAAYRTMRLIPTADTGQTASTEINGFKLGTATRTWAGGNFTNQREVYFEAPVYTFAGPSVITTAATVAIDAVPISGTNATITNAHSLWVQSGQTRFDGVFATGARMVTTVRVPTTTPVTVTTADEIVACNMASSVAVAVDLPSAPAVGTTFVIKDAKGDAGTYNITITPAAGKINGQNTLVISTNNGKARLVYTGITNCEWSAA